MYKTRPASLVKAGPEDGLGEGRYQSLVSVFGNKDFYGDIVHPGAFVKTLEEWEASGDPIPVWWSHRMDDPDYNVGHVLEAKELETGLWTDNQLDLDNPKAAQVYRLLKGRRVTQFSFSYDIVADAESEDDSGEKVHDLIELKIHEVGPTPLGANPETELLEVKTLAQLRSALAGKAGRVLSAKNETALRNAYEQIGAVLSALDQTDDGKAGNRSQAKIEEPSKAKIEEPGQRRARDHARLSAEIALMAAGLPILSSEGLS